VKDSENESIFKDRATMIEIWKERRATTDEYNSMIWKGGQFFFVIISAIISVTFVGLGAYWATEDPGARIGYASTLLFLSFLVLAFCWLGISTARRQFERFLMMAAHVNKIEAILGLTQPVSLPVFPDDTYLFQSFTESAFEKDLKGNLVYRTEMEWIRKKAKGGPNTYTNVRNLYVLLGIIGVVLAILDLSLIISSIIA
jgi:hypothetical protein